MSRPAPDHPPACKEHAGEALKSYSLSCGRNSQTRYTLRKGVFHLPNQACRDTKACQSTHRAVAPQSSDVPRHAHCHKPRLATRCSTAGHCQTSAFPGETWRCAIPAFGSADEVRCGNEARKPFFISPVSLARTSVTPRYHSRNPARGVRGTRPVRNRDEQLRHGLAPTHTDTEWPPCRHQPAVCVVILIARLIYCRAVPGWRNW